MKKSLALLLAGGAAVLFAAAGINAKELTANEVMDRVRDNRYPETSEARIKLILKGKKGRPLTKEFTMYRKVSGNDAMTFIEFEYPPAIRGTRFLVIQKGEKEDTYAKFTENPTVQRISESQRSDRFMGSDFTYGDLRIERKGDDTFEMLGKEEYGGYPCYLIKSTPKSLKKAQYAQLKLWVDCNKFVVRFTEFYDKKKRKKIKKLKIKEVKLIENTWTATLSVMTDLRDGHQTTMELVKARFRVTLDDDLFTLRTLIRGR